MVKHCINAVCKAEFKLFHTGYLYAHERPKHDTEFFWLCSDCATQVAPYIDETNEVRVRPRARGTSFLPPRQGGDLRIVSGPPRRIPWRQNAPANEPQPPMMAGSAGLALTCSPA